MEKTQNCIKWFKNQTKHYYKKSKWINSKNSVITTKYNTPHSKGKSNIDLLLIKNGRNKYGKLVFGEHKTRFLGGHSARGGHSPRG